VFYSGMVYCATTSTGVLVVRREGKVVLCGNTSPIEAPTLEFLIEAPIFVARQFYTHRAASRTEVSYRYSEVPEGFYLPEDADMHAQDTKNRQGRGKALDPDTAAAARNVIERANRNSQEAYHFLAVGTEDGGWGVAREIARQVQPVAAWTRFRWKQDLHNLLHFLSLRLKPNAQLETRRVAEAMADVVAEAYPVVWAAWYEHVFAATTLSAQTAAQVAQIVFMMARGANLEGKRLVEEARERLPKRQRAQFDALLAQGGFPLDGE
jgi:thymidylate synthase (FAD)